MQQVMNNFIKNTIRIAESRITTSTKNGGLGFFKLKEFLIAQKLTWLVRATKYRIDNWRVDLYRLAPNYDITQLRKCDIDKGRHPILYNLVEAYSIFYGSFSRIDGNRKVAQLFDNAIFKHDNGTSTINKVTFGRAYYEEHRDQIRALTFNDMFLNGRFKTMAELAQEGLRLNAVTWFRIRNALTQADTTLKKMTVVTTEK